MCGRYTISSDPLTLQRHFAVPALAAALVPRFNVAPSQRVPIVRRDAQARRELAWAQWGLVPGWVTDPRRAKPLINARAETLAEKPSFRAAWRRRRCLVLADGFYEWRRGPGGKQPYWIHLRSGEPLAFAGLWERWSPPGGEGAALESCAIVTTQANALVAAIHDRMPAILAPEHYDAWLAVASAAELTALAALLAPAPAEALEAIAVARRVNDPSHDDAACLAPDERAIERPR